ncbi:hypothetical protein HK097_003375, partial [Rhizophlyctis rosea]
MSKPSALEALETTIKSFPVKLASTEHQGRYYTAASALPRNSTVLTCETYAFGIFDSHKKRVCAICLAHNDVGAFHLHCKNCDQVYVCSPTCLNDLLSGGHHIVCQALRRLATLKAPQHEKSIMKILLFTLFQRQKERGKLVCTTSTPLKDAIGVSDEPEVVPEVIVESAPDDAQPPPTADPTTSNSVTGTTTPLLETSAHAPRPLPAGHPLLTGKISGTSSIRSTSPSNPSTSTAYDRAYLQQQIHQKLRMYNSTPGASSDSDDDDYSSMSNPHSRTKSHGHLSLFSSSSARSLSPRPASVMSDSSQQQQHGGGGEGSVPLSWEEVESLQSHFGEWPAEDARDWRKTKNFVVKLLVECGLLEEEDGKKAGGGSTPGTPLGNTPPSPPPVVAAQSVPTDSGVVSDQQQPPQKERRRSLPPIRRNTHNNHRNDFDPTEFVLHLISKIESNGFGLWSPKKGNCMGRAIFPRASYFN